MRKKNSGLGATDRWARRLGWLGHVGYGLGEVAPAPGGPRGSGHEDEVGRGASALGWASAMGWATTGKGGGDVAEMG
jgi:hypothetical protein